MDFVAPSDDVLVIDAAGIRNLRMTATVIGGETVYENSIVHENPTAVTGRSPVELVTTPSSSDNGAYDTSSVEMVNACLICVGGFLLRLIRSPGGRLDTDRSSSKSSPHGCRVRRGNFPGGPACVQQVVAPYITEIINNPGEILTAGSEAVSVMAVNHGVPDHVGALKAAPPLRGQRRRHLRVASAQVIEPRSSGQQLPDNKHVQRSSSSSIALATGQNWPYVDIG